MKPLVIAALCAAPLAPVALDSAPATHADPFGFPVPTEGMIIHAPADEPLTIRQVVDAYGLVTDQTMVYTDESLTFLQAARLNTSGPLEVPAERVQATFEALLAMHDFLMVPLTEKAPRVIQVVSMQTGGRNTVRKNAVYVDAEHLDMAAEHPAVLCTTVIAMENTDVRQLSNAMRTMITDANTQQLLPAGNSNSLVLVGTGQGVADLAKMLRTIDDAAAPQGE